MSKTVKEILEEYKYTDEDSDGNTYMAFNIVGAEEAINQLLIEANIEELENLGKNSWLTPPEYKRYVVKDSVIMNRIDELRLALKKDK